MSDRTEGPIQAWWQLSAPLMLFALALVASLRREAWTVRPAALILLIVGGVAQVAGISLVAVEVRSTAHRLAAFRHRPLQLRAAGLMRSGGRANLTRSPAPQTVEERLDHLEATVEAVADSIAQAKTEVAEDLRQEMRQMDGLVAATAHDETTAVAGLLTGLNDRATMVRRVASVVLLIAGTVVVAVGGVLALYE